MTKPPADAADRRRAKAHIAYPVERLPPFDSAFYESARSGLTKVTALTVPPREGRAFTVPAGHFFRIVSIDGPQVGDLNLWNAHDLSERFFSGKTRALHATHVTTGDRLWSTLPNLRPMATITHDTLRWYGWDEDGAGVHDVIGTRCDPYTNLLLNGVDYHHCCHSNLTHALAAERAMPFTEAERHVHDVLNVFMCTGFTRETHQYFMKASPVRPGDFIEFFAEIDLLCALSACPGGDCSSTHSDDSAACHPLRVEVLRPRDWGAHGLAITPTERVLRAARIRLAFQTRFGSLPAAATISALQMIDEVVGRSLGVTRMEIHLPMRARKGARSTGDDEDRIAGILERSLNRDLAVVESCGPDAFPRLADDGPDTPAIVAADRLTALEELVIKGQDVADAIAFVAEIGDDVGVGDLDQRQIHGRRRCRQRKSKAQSGYHGQSDKIDAHGFSLQLLP